METDEATPTALSPEDAQRESRRQLRILVDALPVLIAYVDGEARYRFTNRAHREWYGYAPGEITGKSMQEVLGHAAYSIVQTHVRAALAGQQVRFEADVPHPTRGLRHICATYVPDTLDSGPARGFFSLDSDITDIRRGESVQRRRLEEVARGARLSAMGELATQIAHEVNQPLSAIASFCEAGTRMIARQDAELEEIVEVFSDIATENERAAGIIREMRRLLQKRQPRFADADINEVVRDVLDLARVESGWHGLTVRLDEDPSVAPVHLDRVLIGQVIFNLLHNALDSMKSKPREQRRLVVQTRRHSDNAVEVLVKDNGKGLPKDGGDRIFDPFFTTKTTGTGMGLAISRSIIERHGGRLWATRNPDGGATFRFTLSATDDSDARHTA